MNISDIIKRHKENLLLLKKLALVDVPDLYNLFNSLITDFCNKKYKDILENNPCCNLDIHYDSDMNLGNIRYMVSLYEENILIDINATSIIILKQFIDTVQETILEMNFERFYELYVKNVYVKE